MKKTISKKRRVIRAVILGILSLVLTLILIVASYVIYVEAQYYRIKDNLDLTVGNAQSEEAERGRQYSVLSYNLGFGAYSPDYSFFMDTGVMKNGTKVKGKYAKGKNKADVQKNLDGQLALSKSQNADFYFFQEVDTNSDRSYHINMREALSDAMTGYANIYAENFHTANLIYPFNDPIGTSNSGLLTLSRCAVASATRRSFPITKNAISKLFDLDRCFSLQRLPVAGSEHCLVLINLHMSAYDEGGKIRAKQLEMLNTVLKEERDNENYVIAGGDFNHCLIAKYFDDDKQAAQSAFPCEQEIPDWVKGSVLLESELTQGYTISASMNAATCRGADIPYEAGVNYQTVIDGFIVSGNVNILSEQTVDSGYSFSDHNPVRLEFSLQ